MNYSFSTSWNSKKHKDGHGIVEEIKKLGFDTVELSFALTGSVVGDILEMNKKGMIKVSSLHNMCPLPKEIDPASPSPDHYSLASPNEDERSLAVKIAKNTLDYAKKFGAKAVVLHAGRVQIKDNMRQLAGLIGDRQLFKTFRSDMISERNASKTGCIDNVIKSLGELVLYAKMLDVRLGVENRYHYREIPLVDEFEAIFNNFKPGDIYYWHDAGHAEVFERLGFCKHKDLLDKFQSRLIGMHLHDIIGTIDDHKPPGFGTFDFNIVKPYIRKDTIKVLEIHQPSSGEDIIRGVEYIDKILK